jgi:hypothetical protein
MATKLHELLAVEKSLRSQAEATPADLINTFEKKRTHFTEQIITFHSNKEGIEPKVESKMAIQTTVPKELEWISAKIDAAIDAAYQIDETNTVAQADIVLDNGRVLLTGIPATSLLSLEKRIVEIHQLVDSIPTLDPTKGFAPDTDRGAGIFRARDVTKPRTEKVFDYVVMVAPTDKHPAQVKELMKDVSTGDIVQQEWSSLVTVSDKGDMLDRVEELARAIKKARSRANEQEVDKDQKIASYLTNYVFKGI